MARRAVAFSRADAKRVARVVRRVEQDPLGPEIVRRGPRLQGVPPHLEGILDDDLDPANAIDDPTTATLSVWRFTVGGVLADTGVDVTVTNRDPAQSASTGDYCRVEYLAGEWRPIRGGEGGGGAGLGTGVVLVDANYTTQAGDRLVLGDPDATAPFTVTLGAAAAANSGQTISVQCIGVLKASTVTVNTIESTTGAQLNPVLANGANVTAVSDGGLQGWWGPM